MKTVDISQAKRQPVLLDMTHRFRGVKKYPGLVQDVRTNAVPPSVAG